MSRIAILLTVGPLALASAVPSLYDFASLDRSLLVTRFDSAMSSHLRSGQQHLGTPLGPLRYLTASEDDGPSRMVDRHLYHSGGRRYLSSPAKLSPSSTPSHDLFPTDRPRRHTVSKQLGRRFRQECRETVFARRNLA